jgi:APA family basic amino acid/polyamine antiporter
MTTKTKFSLTTATALVIANMVGAGVFTSLGFQIGLDKAGNPVISSGLALILLWVLGGAIALFGALTYSEAGVMFPRCGGEYNYLTKMYHPALGFMAVWISFTVGFAAPVAAASIAFAKYFREAFSLRETLATGFLVLSTEKILAISVVVLVTLVHSVDKILGARFQNAITIFKVFFIFLLIVLGFAFGKSTQLSFAPSLGAWHDFWGSAFWISMFFVTFSYSGWNAAAYVAGEIDRPARNLPISLITGTLFVIAMYVLLNFIFLYTVPLPELAGKLEVGFIFATKVFGTAGGRIMGGIISFLLLSSISAMIIAGPRLSRAIGEDFYLFRWLGKNSRKDIPVIAILTQAVITIVYIVSGKFDQVIIFVGFTLNLFTFLTVLGVILARKKFPELPRPYKTLGYPVVPFLFLAIHVVILGYGLAKRPIESMLGLLITAVGFLIYLIDKKVRPADFKPLGDDAPCP